MIKAKKIFSTILISTMAVSLLWGCKSDKPVDTPTETPTSTTPANSGDDKKEDDNKQVSIRVASTFTGADPYTPIWQEVLKDFSTKYPNIKIIDEATSAAGDAFKTKVNADFASGNEPDVVYGFNGEIGRPIVESGKVISWEDELKSDSAWAANFLPGPLESGKFEGKLYCLPYLGFFEGMWVNKDVFENNGLQVPKTYEDIVKAIPVLREKGITPIACSFAEEPHYIIETFLLSMGGAQGHNTPFDPSWAPALNLIKDLFEKKAFTEDALTIKQASCAEMFANKKAAMFVSGSWSGGQFTDKENTAVIPLPLVTGGKADPSDIIGGAGTGWYLVKDLNDEKNGAGMTFIKYMTSPEVMAKFVAVSGVNCIKCEVNADTKMKQSGIDLINNAKSMNSPVGDVMNQEAFTTIWKGLQYVVTGEKTAEQLLEEAKKLAN